MQYQFLLQLGLTKSLKETVFDEEPGDGHDGDDGTTDDPYGEDIPKKTKKKRERCEEVCDEVVVEADPLATCRDCDMVSCNTKIAGEWCCKTAPDLPKFRDEDSEDGMDEDSEDGDDGDTDEARCREVNCVLFVCSRCVWV